MQLLLSQCSIRSFRASDDTAIVRHLGNRNVSCNMCVVPFPYTLDHAREWIALATAGTPETHFAIAVDDQVVGGIGIIPGACGVKAHSGEIGYWLGEDFWGRGIMTEAVRALTAWAFHDLRMIRLHASVFARNPASARVLEKAGYVFEGRMRAQYQRDGTLIDGLLYAAVRVPSEMPL